VGHLFPYWLLFFILAAGAVMYAWPRLSHSGDGTSTLAVQQNLLLNCTALLILLMIGFRYEVGGDWSPYLRIFRGIGSKDFGRAFITSGQEPGYTLVNWIVWQAGLGIWLVNLLCALPFVAGLIALCRRQPNPWLALVVATPQFIIGVGMGYTRQAAAAGFLMIGLAKLLDGRSFRAFVVWALLGAMFHQSVLIFVPLVALFLFQARYGSVLLVVPLIVIGYAFLLPKLLGAYSAGYIRTVFQSQGAIFRLGLNAFAGALVLAFPRRFHTTALEMRIWRGWALLALASLAAFLTIASTVILDRLAVYLLPLQIYALSRVPAAFGQRGSLRLVLTAVVIGYSATVLLIWLTLANNAISWVPYRLYPFD
jgi:hypothetical protein